MRPTLFPRLNHANSFRRRGRFLGREIKQNPRALRCGINVNLTSYRLLFVLFLLIDVWIHVQRRLEGIFSGSADIKHLLPDESARFQNINSRFVCWHFYGFIGRRFDARSRNGIKRRRRDAVHLKDYPKIDGWLEMVWQSNP
jgi:hypothetical protein